MQQQRQEDMKKPRSQEHAALCLLIWSCLECALSDFLEVQPTFPGEETSTETFRRGAANGTTAQSNLSAQCTPLFPPNYGFYYIEEGAGNSLGAVITYWCREGYQLVGNGKLTCLLEGNISYWSHSPPHCEVIPKPLDKGFRVAVIASLISGMIIITMSILFTICYLRDRMLRETAQEGETSKVQRSRRRFKIGRANSTKQETGKQRGHCGKPKHNHRLQYRTSALYSCAYPGALARCNNQDFQRGQENLQKVAPQSLCPEIHIFPQVVLKPSTVPSASMFLHLPQKPGGIPLNLIPSARNLPQDLSSAHYGRYDGLSYLNKY